MSALPILVVEDDAALREAIVDTLELAGFGTVTASDGRAALQLLAQQPVGMVVSDVAMQPMDGNQLLREVKVQWPHLPVLLMTAYGVIEHAVASLQAGACHYLPKPFAPDALVSQVTRFALTQSPGEGSDMLAHDPATLQLRQLAERVAQSDATVLISGESGTGKEVLARFIHQHSARRNKPFIAINCAAIPESLLESTLFGHEKGAFTGAAQSHAGKFEQAQGGTLLLDEVSEMPLPLQAKLLRVLQEREVERVGGSKPIALDIRVLATSNRDMASWVKEGKFREDLFYRLNVFPLPLPSLRERPGDIVPLAKQTLQRLASGQGRRFTAAAEAALRAYAFPGNVRELENVVQRALILAPNPDIDAADLMLPGGVAAALTEPAAEGNKGEMPSNMRDLERQHILDTLAACHGVRRLAAEKLGMSERTLRYKLAQFRDEGWVEAE
ncbi:sigma-54-dependent transcriptional regulator [Leeia sp.]|uniref:sigma-54-dependent transcriptional regulator n=1 Tax=Leeia sp. TaxID=2884678 RepID=UPI0035B11E79